MWRSRAAWSGCHCQYQVFKTVARVPAATRKGWQLSLIVVVSSLPSEVQFSVAVHSQVHVLVSATRRQTSGSELLILWGRATGQRI
jgi:hypothetical protein